MSSHLIISALIAVIFLLTLIPFIYEAKKRKTIDPFSPILWISMGFFFTFGVEAARHIINDDFNFYAQIVVDVSPIDVIWALLWVIISLIMIISGYYWKNRPILQLDSNDRKLFTGTWSSERAWLSALVLFIIGVSGYVYLLPEIGSGPRSQLTRGPNMIGFIAVNILNISSIVIVANIFISYVKISNNKIKIARGSTILIIIGIMLTLINIYILSLLGGRRNALHILIAGLFLFHYLLKRISLTQGISIYLLLNVFQEYLAEVVLSLFTLEITEIKYTLLSPVLFNTATHSGFNNLVVIFAGSERVDHTLGSTLISPFFILLRPFGLQFGVESDVAFNTIFHPSAVGVFGYPMTLVGELYLNFSYPGIVIGFFAIGILIRIFYELTALSGKTEKIIIFCMVTNSYPLFANFSNSVPALFLRTLPLFLVLLYVTRSSIFKIYILGSGESPEGV